MLITKKLWGNNYDLALLSLKTNFVQGIKTGKLPKKEFQEYVAQDSYFLDSFAKGYKMAINKSTSNRSKEILCKLLQGVKDELVLHEKYAKQWGVDLQGNKIKISTKKYTDFLENISLNCSYVEILCAMSPCRRLYAWLGKKLERELKDNPYREWIKTYADDDFEKLAKSLENLIDTNGKLNLQKANDIYKEAMTLEFEFFQSYSGFLLY